MSLNKWDSRTCSEVCNLGWGDVHFWSAQVPWPGAVWTWTTLTSHWNSGYVHLPQHVSTTFTNHTSWLDTLLQDSCHGHDWTKSPFPAARHRSFRWKFSTRRRVAEAVSSRWRILPGSFAVRCSIKLLFASLSTQIGILTSLIHAADDRVWSEIRSCQNNFIVYHTDNWINWHWVPMLSWHK